MPNHPQPVSRFPLAVVTDSADHEVSLVKLGIPPDHERIWDRHQSVEVARLGVALREDLVTKLLPILGKSLDLGFNVFDVMHHGTHEKQISNVFGWLLDIGGTHNLGDQFVRTFVEELNRRLPAQESFPSEGYTVRQEVNTVSNLNEADIADLVLEGEAARLVVENYFTSDGHGHSYESYLSYSRRDGKNGAVVLLCREEDLSRLSQGWENAHVLTYRTLIDRLHQTVEDDERYQQENPDAHSFIRQMHRKFVSERGLVEDRDVLNFVTTLCKTGDSQRFGWVRQAEVAEKFASDVAAQARQRFLEGRELLQRIKAMLRAYGAGPLRAQLNATLGGERVQRVSATYSGIYQWSINFDLAGLDKKVDGPMIQFKFGPTAQHANEQDPDWKDVVDPDSADYSHLFITRREGLVIRQSTVTLQEVLNGLQPDDRRLHDEIIALLQADSKLPAV